MKLLAAATPKHSWSLSSALITKEPLCFPSSGLTPDGTKMGTALPAGGEGWEVSAPAAWGSAALPGPSGQCCCGPLPSHLGFSVFEVSVREALLIFLFRVDRISSEALFVLWLCPSVCFWRWRLFFLFLGRWVMYLIQVNNSHDYCKKYSCFCSVSESKFLETALVFRQNSHIF